MPFETQCGPYYVTKELSGLTRRC